MVFLEFLLVNFRYGLNTNDLYEDNDWILKEGPNAWPAGYIDINLFQNLNLYGEMFCNKLY
jgi:hypothetical protein